MRDETVINATPWVSGLGVSLQAIAFFTGPKASLLLTMISLAVLSAMMGALLTHRPPRAQYLDALRRLNQLHR